MIRGWDRSDREERLFELAGLDYRTGPDDLSCSSTTIRY